MLDLHKQPSLFFHAQPPPNNDDINSFVPKKFRMITFRPIDSNFTSRIAFSLPRYQIIQATSASSCSPSMSSPEPKSKSGNKEEEKVVVAQLPQPPEKPLPSDCCGSGCVRCVWDVYFDELEEYNKTVEAIKAKEEDQLNSKSNSQ